MMKGFNISFYDDRRLCHMEGCTEMMIAYKWDHAVRDFMDETKRFPTLCCLPKNRSLQLPPVDECTDASKYHEVRAWLLLSYILLILLFFELLLLILLIILL